MKIMARITGLGLFLFAVSGSAKADVLANVAPDTFPLLACSDGWASCDVDGQTITPDMLGDASGRPHPSDMRYGFFDLDALPGLSPFVTLSSFAQVPEAGGGDGGTDSGIIASATSGGGAVTSWHAKLAEIPNSVIVDWSK